MPRWAQGNLWHLAFLAQNTAVLHCCLIPDPSPLESHNSSIRHYIPRSCRALWAQQSPVNTWVDITPSISCTDWCKGKPAAVQMLFLSLYSTHAWHLARLISVHFYSLTLATSGIGSPWGNIPGIQAEIMENICEEYGCNVWSSINDLWWWNDGLNPKHRFNIRCTWLSLILHNTCFTTTWLNIDM